MNKYCEVEFLSLWNWEIDTSWQKCSSANEHLERLTLRFTDAIGINGNIAASFSAMIPNCPSAVARLIVGVFFSGDFSGWKSIRNTIMININIGLNTTPPPQFEVKGKLECRIKPLICYLHLIWSLVSKVELKGQRNNSGLWTTHHVRQKAIWSKAQHVGRLPLPFSFSTVLHSHSCEQSLHPFLWVTGLPSWNLPKFKLHLAIILYLCLIKKFSKELHRH